VAPGSRSRDDERFLSPAIVSLPPPSPYPCPRRLALPPPPLGTLALATLRRVTIRYAAGNDLRGHYGFERGSLGPRLSSRAAEALVQEDRLPGSRRTCASTATPRLLHALVHALGLDFSTYFKSSPYVL
jgi:hypothetical protein